MSKKPATIETITYKHAVCLAAGTAVRTAFEENKSTHSDHLESRLGNKDSGINLNNT